MIRVREDKQDRAGTEIERPTKMGCQTVPALTRLKKEKKKQAEMGMDRVCESKDSCKDFCKKKKSMRYFSGAAGTALIIPSDLSIPSNSDICGKSVRQKNNL